MKRIARLIPKKLRHSLYRKSAIRGFDTSKDVRFKIADSKEEIEQAFSLVYRVYRERNWTEPFASEMCLSKIYALPTTKILVAIENGEVVATMTVQRDGTFRTPCEEYFDLTSQKSFIEISHFAYDPRLLLEWRSYLFPLAKLALTLNKNFFQVKYLVAGFTKDNFDIWSSLAFFRNFGEKTIPIQNQAVPFVCGYADIAEIEREMEKRKNDNFFHYLFVKTDSRIQSELNPPYTREILDYFFNKKTNIFSVLTSFESRTIHKIYSDDDYADILPIQNAKVKNENLRHTKRFSVGMKAVLISAGGSVVNVIVRTISMSGLGLVCEEKLLTDKTYRMKIDGREEIELLVSPVWLSRDAYGFVIRKQSAGWKNLIEEYYIAEKKAS